MARRLGDRGSGQRTVGYDANPSGIAGTTSSASDYKKAKEAKKKDKERVELGKPPPYENDEGFIPGHNGIQYFTETLDPKTKDYKPELVVIGKGVKDTKGEGWTLSLRIHKEKVHVLTAMAGSSLFIYDVSDKGQIKLPNAPLENGNVKNDTKVVMPKTLKVSGYVPREDAKFLDTCIKDAERSRSLGTYFKLQSPWKTYEKMYLKDYSSKANNKKYDVYDYTITLQELLIATDLKDKTSDAELASNTNKGASSGK